MTPSPWNIKAGAYGVLHVGPATLPHPTSEAQEYAALRGRDLLAEREAVARLIAAAPDMLEALEKLSRAFDLDEHDEDRAHAEACAMREARAAITQAKEP